MKFTVIAAALLLAGTALLPLSADNTKPAAAKPAVIQTAAPVSGTAGTAGAAAAETAVADEQAAENRSPWTGMLPMIIVFGVIIIFMTWSSKKQQKKRQQMQDALTKGSQVVLNSGVFGTISEVRQNDFLVEIAPGVKVAALKNCVNNAEQFQQENNGR